ncbi:MAG: ATP-binding protein, partial [Gammaproteobacteria bacterium]
VVMKGYPDLDPSVPSTNDPAEHTRTQEVLSRLGQRVSAQLDPEFYQNCVRDLAAYYGARIVAISLFADTARTRMRTLLCWQDGEFQENVEYSLSGTPCQTVLDARQQYVPEKVQSLYPRDEYLAVKDIESYFGVPLGEPYSNGPGLISILDTKPMCLSMEQQSVLRVYATRIAREMAWKRPGEQSNQEALEQEIAQLGADLGVAYRELNGIYDVINHDLRAPLRSVCGFSAAVLEEIKELDQGSLVADYCHRIHKAGQRMQQQIDDLGHLRSVSSSEIMISPVNLSRLMEEVVTSMRESWRYEHEVYCDIEVDLRVLADRYMFKEMLMQLVDNAWKFTARVENPRVRLYREVQGSETVFVLEDNGIGFDMRYANKLFTLFHKLHCDVGFEGSGIGLALVQRVIHRHGGKIWADSVLGQGSRFCFTLPEGPA